MNLLHVVSELDELLDVDAVSDYCPNGLQVEGREEIRRIVTAVSASIELFEAARETLLQLVVNTISFVRVGAFALAHASLSAALVSLAEATGSPFGGLFVMLVGNLLVILLDTNVLSALMRRTPDPGVHSGQMSFPGGAAEPGDTSM